jgi:hypothetical protein
MGEIKTLRLLEEKRNALKEARIKWSRNISKA